MKPLYVPKQETRAKITVVNSRFIASISPAFSVEQAKSYVDRIKSEFQSASHNVSAFIIGHGQSIIAHCTDDGEPSGTAGRPILSVLQGSNLGDVVMVVTRFFGGTKLGRGGLVRAYSAAAKQALKTLQIAEKVVTHKIMFEVPYNLYAPSRILLEKHLASDLDEVFEEAVTLTARLREEQYDAFKLNLNDLTYGTAEITHIDTQHNTILPVTQKNN
jgi:uncharacterized YigZ family protein